MVIFMLQRAMIKTKNQVAEAQKTTKTRGVRSCNCLILKCFSIIFCEQEDGSPYLGFMDNCVFEFMCRFYRRYLAGLYTVPFGIAVFTNLLIVPPEVFVSRGVSRGRSIHLHKFRVEPGHTLRADTMAEFRA